MGEHVHLRRRNDAIRRLRFEEGRKQEEIAAIITRTFGRISAARVGQILRASKSSS